MDSIAVVGASLAGTRAVAALRRGGFAGRVIVIGDEGQAPYDRPPLSKQIIAGKADPASTALLDEPARTALGADWRLGVAATGLDLAERRVDLDDGSSVGYDGLVIATGARPRWLPWSEGVPGVHVVRSLSHAVRLRADLDRGPAHVVVVGAGFIGAEVAASARSRGLNVTLVDPLPTPLGTVLPPLIGEVLAGLHRAHGVQVRTGVGVLSPVTDDLGRVNGVALDSGETLAADVVVLGLGVTPNVDWLSGSGLVLDDGVVADATCLAAPGVVVAGDVARWRSQRYQRHLRVEHWTHASEQGEYAARRLLAFGRGEPIAPFDPVPYFWSDQYDRKIQFAGRAAPDDDLVIVDGALSEGRFVALHGRNGHVTGVFGINRPSVVLRWRARLAAGVSWSAAVAEHVCGCP